MPYVPVRLKAPKPKDLSEPQTLGEHIKRRQLQQKLTQTQAGKLLVVDTYTVLNWEKGKTEPPIAAMPAVLRFLGYDPFPPPKHFQSGF